MSREQSFNIIRTVVSMGVAIAVAFIIILLVSDQPVESIRIFLLAPLSSKRYLGNIVETAVPLIFSGLSMALMFKASLFNLGGEGIFFISGITGSILAGCLHCGGRCDRNGHHAGTRGPEGKVRGQ